MCLERATSGDWTLTSYYMYKSLPGFYAHAMFHGFFKMNPLLMLESGKKKARGMI